MSLLTREPVLTVAAVQALLTAGAAFGLNLSADQLAALVGVSGALLAVLVRQAVISPATVADSAVRPQEVTGLAGALVKRAREESRGSAPVALILFIAVMVLILAGIFVACDAMFEDDDERDDLGRSVVASALLVCQDQRQPGAGVAWGHAP